MRCTHPGSAAICVSIARPLSVHSAAAKADRQPALGLKTKRSPLLTVRRYNPTMSRTFSMKYGSLDSLKLLARCALYAKQSEISWPPSSWRCLCLRPPNARSNV